MTTGAIAGTVSPADEVVARALVGHYLAGLRFFLPRLLVAVLAVAIALWPADPAGVAAWLALMLPAALANAVALHLVLAADDISPFRLRVMSGSFVLQEAAFASQLAFVRPERPEYIALMVAGAGVLMLVAASGRAGFARLQAASLVAIVVVGSGGLLLQPTPFRIGCAVLLPVVASGSWGHFRGTSRSVRAAFVAGARSARLAEELRRRTVELERTLLSLRRTQSELALAQRMKALGLLAAGIAHEINTPTQYIGDNVAFLGETCTELLEGAVAIRAAVEDEGDVSEAVRAALDRVPSTEIEFLRDELPSAIEQTGEGIALLSGIVSSMQSYSFSDRDPEPLDLAAIFETVLTLSRSEWRETATTEAETEPGLGVVMGLKGDIQQVLLNLVVNAAHAVEERFGRRPDLGRIELSARAAGARVVEIRVTDNGAGIGPDVSSRVFDRFYTTKAVGKGTGQGLALAYDLVTNRYGGKLSFTSTPDEGTTFTVELPAGPSPLESSPAGARANTAWSGTGRPHLPQLPAACSQDRSTP